MGGKGWDDFGKGGYGKFQPAPPAAKSNPGTKLFIGNLSGEIDEHALRYVFANYGTVEKVHIMTGKSKSGQACAFVEYATNVEAETAILTLNEKYEIKPGDGPILVRHADNKGGRSNPC